MPGLREARSIDFVTANGENLAGGMGLTMTSPIQHATAPARRGALPFAGFPRRTRPADAGGWVIAGRLAGRAAGPAPL